MSLEECFSEVCCPIAHNTITATVITVATATAIITAYATPAAALTAITITNSDLMLWISIACICQSVLLLYFCMP
jgi:hypothetical protein